MKLEFESNTSTLPYNTNNYAAEAHPENSGANVLQMLQAGIKAAQAGDRSEARQLLVQVTEADPDNETAWLWMASISEYPEELIIFLNNVLSVNPTNARALEWMKATKSLLARTFVERGVEASNDANMDLAKQCFWQAIAHDDRNETAWLSLASAADLVETKITYLQKVVSINPENESARISLEAAKKQAAEALLRKANSAAVAGNREDAREMLREVLDHSPDLEEAWILKAYLAESFSEKITCYEKVLTFNPENEMAVSGLASLRAIMAKTEAKKAEQAAFIAEFDKNVSAQENPALTEDHYAFTETAEDENSPTQKLEFPPDYIAPQYQTEEFGNFTTSSLDEYVELAEIEDSEQNYSDFYRETEPVSSQTFTEENSVNDKVPTENHLMNHNAFDNQTAASVKEPDIDSAYEYENAQTSPLSDTFNDSYPEIEKGFFGSAVKAQFGENRSKHSFEATDCPFCRADNEAHAFICSSCGTMLTLSDLEMLLAHTEVNQEVLRQAVGQMEAEMNRRSFNAVEFKNLAVGYINLKDLRQGIEYLQKASQMAPNDVMLYSQVNSLKIRFAEIEQQESHNSQMAKGRKILVVDDSATVRKLISSKLEKSGHEVVSAVDGVDAMEIIKEFTPDLILLDIMMPKLDGYQVCKLIRTNELTKDVPIVMISGKDGFFDKVRGRMAGTTGYITKPFGPETLMKAVETYIVHDGEMMSKDEETGYEK